MNLLDAARIEDDSIAQATLPYVLPMGFHGNSTAAQSERVLKWLVMRQLCRWPGCRCG